MPDGVSQDILNRAAQELGFRFHRQTRFTLEDDMALARARLDIAIFDEVAHKIVDRNLLESTRLRIALNARHLNQTLKKVGQAIDFFMNLGDSAFAFRVIPRQLNRDAKTCQR